MKRRVGLLPITETSTDGSILIDHGTGSTYEPPLILDDTNKGDILNPPAPDGKPIYQPVTEGSPIIVDNTGSGTVVTIDENKGNQAEENKSNLLLYIGLGFLAYYLLFNKS